MKLMMHAALEGIWACGCCPFQGHRVWTAQKRQVAARHKIVLYETLFRASACAPLPDKSSMTLLLHAANKDLGRFMHVTGMPHWHVQQQLDS